MAGRLLRYSLVEFDEKAKRTGCTTWWRWFADQR